MAWHLYGAKPLPEPMLTYHQVTYCEQASVKFESKYENFDWKKFIWKCHLQTVHHFTQEEMS